ncbi:MAG TPA: DUF72 domain-containing protein [Vicinamibacterales bacterium]|nr:DUF72 domain-containing protein [Vicinamibacterales bacterium]
MARTEAPRVGCSGWQYRHWRGSFYPDRLPSPRWLEHYVQTFDTVEVNNTFYRLPQPATFTAWRDRVPSRFVFAVKASRYLTHLKRLRDPEEPVARLFDRAAHLGNRLGPVLYQLPPAWPRDLERLRRFLDTLPPGYRHALEFRDPDWYAGDVFDALVQHNAALCVHDMPGSSAPLRAVGPFIYLRLHGAGSRYGGRYPDDRLDAWAEWLASGHAAGLPVYAYFNNDVGGHAPRDACRLRDRLAKLVPA